MRLPNSGVPAGGSGLAFGGQGAKQALNHGSVPDMDGRDGWASLPLVIDCYSHEVPGGTSAATVELKPPRQPFMLRSKPHCSCKPLRLISCCF